MRDRRGATRETQPNDEVHQRAVGLLRQVVCAQVQSARVLRRLDQKNSWAHYGASSLPHYVALQGHSIETGRVLQDAGKAFVIRPHLEQLVLAGKISIESAAALLKVLTHPGLADEIDEWVERARKEDVKTLRRNIRRRIAEVEAQDDPIEPLLLHLKASQRDKLSRAREILSRKTALRRALSLEETVEGLSDYFLDRVDPDRKQARARRKPDTTGDPGRAVPASEKRKIRARGGKCQVPHCPHRIFTQHAHIFPHGRGGSREASNLLDLCWTCHWLLDTKLISVSGTADNPVFRDARGEIIGGRPMP